MKKNDVFLFFRNIKKESIIKQQKMNVIISQKVENQKINYHRVGYLKEDIQIEDFTESIIDYDEFGNIVKETRFLPDSSIDTIILNEYNANNQLISTSEYDETGELILQVLSSFDADHHLILQQTQYGANSPYYSSRFVYEAGLLKKQEAYIEDTLDGIEKEYFYNEHQQLIEERHYDDAGEMQSLFNYQYDANGQVIEMMKKELLVENILSGGRRAEDVRTYEYAYDNRGNQIKVLIYNYEEELIMKVYRKFNDENRLIEEEEEDLDNYRKTVYTREGELLVKIAIYNKEDKMDSWIDFEYDVKKRNTKMVQYVKDETDEESYRTLYEHIKHYIAPEA